MKRHITTYPLLLILFALIVACTQQEHEELEAPDEATITFSVTSEQTFDTRASADNIGKGNNVNRLVCAVYDVHGNLLNELGNTDNGQLAMDFPTGGVNVRLRLARGQEYKVVFWASCAECTAYNTDDLSDITVDYSKMLCNDDKCDAFCKAEVFTVSSGDETRSVVLRRPFAQFNIGMLESEFEALKEQGIDFSSSQITLGPVANAFNAVDNSISTSDIAETATFAKATIPNEHFYVETVSDDETINTEYKYLAMCYLLVADINEATSTYSTVLNNVSVTLFDDSKNENTTIELQEIPVQRNWTTNICFTKESLTNIY